MQKTKGISLIVLVITIIVMIILAGAIVLTLNNSGIIDKATSAVEDSNLATVKQLASLGWAEAYADGARTKEALEEGVYEILEANNVDTEAYVIVVTTSGVKVVRGWIQDGLTVKRGSTVLTIGDDFEYDETAEGTKDVAWKVLGASEDGELLIMSTSNIVSNYILGDQTDEDLEECQNDWLTGATQLDDLCEPYGKGEGATGARSVTVEDVDKITGFDKITYEKGKLSEYGNEVTYTYNGTTKPAYTATNGLSGTLGTHSNGFHYYNGTDFVVADLSTGAGIITTLKIDYYIYSAPNLKTIDKTSKAYTMLFGEYGAEDTYYWLASPYVNTFTNHAYFGMRNVGNGYVRDYDVWDSYGCCCDYYGRGVRAVVSLASDIQVTGDSTNGWSY